MFISVFGIESRKSVLFTRLRTAGYTSDTGSGGPAWRARKTNEESSVDDKG